MLHDRINNTMTTDDEKKLDEEFYNVGNYKLTYMVTVPSVEHYNNRIKIGDATYHTSKTIEEIIEEAFRTNPELARQGIITTPEINAAADKRVKEWAGTADLPTQIVFTSLNVRETVNGYGKKIYEGFRDYQVHDVLIRSGFQKNFVRQGKKNGEWFNINLTDAIAGYKAYLNGKSSFGKSDEVRVPINLRDEQLNAVKRTKKHFNKGTVEKPKKFLWNAIMRFGKTLTTYKLVQDMYEKDENFKKVLVITHRPVVSAGWSEDFFKIFGHDSEWQFGAKKKEYGINWEDLNKDNPFVYFASIQDLRGSFNSETDSVNPTNDSKVNSISSDETALETEEQVNEEIEKLVHDDKELEELFSKNAELFNTEFSMVIIDEGHEGIGTELAQKMMGKIKASYKLHLSGTPFNIIEGFDDKEIFNWTYIDERKAAEQWERDRKALDGWNGEDEAPIDKQRIEKVGDLNPYGSLPTLEIRTINIEKTIQNPAVKKISDAGDKVDFNFRKFFEVELNPAKAVAGTFYPSYAPFTHKDMIAELLNKIFANDANKPEGERRLFPFGDNHSKNLFAHTLWILPSVDSAIALHEILNEIAPEFYVVNATGDNDSGNALADVQKAVQEHDRTITLSVGKLTTGTTVPEWTGVFLLNNMKSPMNYMQTIFRVKSSGTLFDGRRKEVGYVFDFAPNRTLEMISQAAAATPRKKEEGVSGNSIDDDKTAVDELLNYLPIISYDGTKFEKRDTNSLMQTLKRVYIREAVDKGFETPKMFKFDPHTISTEDKKVLEGVKEIIKAAGYEKAKSVKINESELSEELKNPAPVGDRAPKPKQEISEAEKARKEDLKNAKNIRDLLMGVTVRIPLLVMAHDFENSEITVHNFSEIVDEESWSEFMPKGFRKDMWKDIIKFFDQTVFEGACKEIHERVNAMDDMLPLDRVAAMANLFSTFKNPDKETVLTPWRVVSMQTSQTLGGLRFVDDDGQVHDWNEIEDSDGLLKIEPVWVDQNVDNLWNSSSTFYDINSKSALYPLYAAASLFYKRWNSVSEDWKRKQLINGVSEKDMQTFLWNHVVKDQIFVNVRVPYSKKIAQTVLLGYNKNEEINCSVVDVVEERNKLKEIKFSEDGVKKPRSLKADEVNKIIGWVLLGVKDKGENSMSVEKRFAILDKSVSEALAKADAMDDEKFTAVLSNPPYQMEIEGNKRSIAVYHHFAIVAQTMTKYLSMIYPSRWTQGGFGDGLDDFREKELVSPKYSVYHDYSSSNSVFEDVGIAGGINFYLWDTDKNEKGLEYYYDNTRIRKDYINDSKIYVRDPRYAAIIDKISPNFTMNSIVAARRYYGANVRRFQEIEEAAESFVDFIKVYYTKPGKGVVSKNLSSNVTARTAEEWKVFVSKTAHEDSNTVYSRPDRIFVGEPNSIVSDSFLKVGDFKTEKEANNCLLYIKTFFASKLFALLTPSQNTTSKNYSLIPDVDFATGEIKDKPGVFLNFDNPETLDEQLAGIYGLTKEEQELMKSSIKPWKDKLSLTADGLY